MARPYKVKMARVTKRDSNATVWEEEEASATVTVDKRGKRTQQNPLDKDSVSGVAACRTTPAFTPTGHKGGPPDQLQLGVICSESGGSPAASMIELAWKIKENTTLALMKQYNYDATTEEVTLLVLAASPSPQTSTIKINASSDNDDNNDTKDDDDSNDNKDDDDNNYDNESKDDDDSNDNDNKDDNDNNYDNESKDDDDSNDNKDDNDNNYDNESKDDDDSKDNDNKDDSDDDNKDDDNNKDDDKTTINTISNKNSRYIY
ncbi:protein PFC0760c-like [Homarus americanus]|uniref:protein PFC0760c-like n=1 Tax=Homarus americanus TaxID=6706 RepID=UPI001C46178F|nr:protein PFC0760c-like [Homarus americanus]